MVLCGVNSCAFGANAFNAGLRDQFTVMNWVKNKNDMRLNFDFKSHAFNSGALVALGVGGFIGTGFLFKKIAHVCRESIVLLKQIKQTTKDYRKNVFLRKKRRALISQAIGMGIGGLVLGLVSGASFWHALSFFQKIRAQYSSHKFAWTQRSELPRYEPVTITNEENPLENVKIIGSSITGFDPITVIPGRMIKKWQCGGRIQATPRVPRDGDCIYYQNLSKNDGSDLFAQAFWKDDRQYFCTYVGADYEPIHFYLRPWQWSDLGFVYTQ